jgi:hypothetical protein
MLPLEVVGPGDSLSTLLMPRLPGRTTVRECPGSSNNDGGIQLQLDGGGARLLAGAWLGGTSIHSARTLGRLL